MTDHPPKWLEWAREIEALSQTGLHYAGNVFDHQRYNRLLEISAEIIAGYSNLGRAALIQAFLAQNGYATPKVDVRAAVFQEGKLLMVRESSDNRWTLPGGWADVGETPSAVTLWRSTNAQTRSGAGKSGAPSSISRGRSSSSC